MKLFFKGKDGGPESKVWGYWLIESKKFFSLALLRFENGARDAYHTHAFDSVSLVLSGTLKEQHLVGFAEEHGPGKVVLTYRKTFHKVTSVGRTWVLTVRGPWAPTWREKVGGNVYVLRNGRKRVEKNQN